VGHSLLAYIYNNNCKLYRNPHFCQALDINLIN